MRLTRGRGQLLEKLSKKTARKPQEGGRSPARPGENKPRGEKLGKKEKSVGGSPTRADLRKGRTPSLEAGGQFTKEKASRKGDFSGTLGRWFSSQGRAPAAAGPGLAERGNLHGVNEGGLKVWRAKINALMGKKGLPRSPYLGAGKKEHKGGGSKEEG